ncbi:putative permease [Sedimentisphaera cyanobacteriorum]|uniref:Putative permease n=1 Tax=Sedimentisphaera cyanobacteriorum TaxID=1940790 RepID=A0A1Q2HS81_9BACT|nr:SO_0444 family Cu/Zn efflux transporter [Sedimentisphaera cyanobacteriorum]AQQ10319.1 putative permease [Sedimentisphaera cyanobacteriorum]
MDFLKTFMKDFWDILGEMSPFLILGFFIAGLVSVFLSASFVRQHLGGGSLPAVFKASLFGVPLPLCSCGVMPVTLSLKEAGAGKGSAVSFLISTPQTGIDSVAVTYSLLGPVFAIVRPIAAFLSGIFGGMAVSVFDKELATSADQQPENLKKQSENENTETYRQQLKRLGAGGVLKETFSFGFLHLPLKTGRAMLIGLIIAALITVLVPDDFFIEQIQPGFWTLALMVVLGIPIYVCSSASVPIAAALIMKGLSPGAALVFLMTGPATNAASYAVLWKHFGGRCALLYFGSVVVCALGAGIILDYFTFEVGMNVAEAAMSMPPAWLRNSSAVILMAVLLVGTLRDLANSIKSRQA